MAVVAIDGPSGAGKSSVSRAVAGHFQWSYLDTGALYRAVTLLAIESQLTQGEAIASILKPGAITWIGDPAAPQILLADRNVNAEIRTQNVTERVSEIAAQPEVRAHLLDIQRAIINAAPRGIVVEGRDIGTTVWPDAELKIFLTADLQARAERRNAELVAKFSDSDVQAALAARDIVDSTRTTSPLRQIAEQVEIDATHLSFEQVVTEIKNLITELKLAEAGDSNGR